MRGSPPRLPRIRGDLPLYVGMFAFTLVIPPHARGFILLARRVKECEVGCPARAGIYHGFWKRPGEWYSCPVSRGDLPVDAEVKTAKQVVAFGHVRIYRSRIL